MKQLTRQEVEGVMERLVDRTLSFGCLVLDKTTRKTSRLSRITNSGDAVVVGHVTGVFTPVSFSNEFIVLGHHITIGDVLEKINEKDKPDRDVMWLALSHLWQPLGLSKSLQEIVSESGYEIYTDLVYAELQLLRSPKANALFSFLIEIGL